MVSGDTIAAIATAKGRGGVAVIRVSGPAAFAIGERLSGRKIVAGRVAFAHIGQPTIDEAVVLGFKSPHSYTGEDVVELQCHGGSVSPRRVLEAAISAGARLARRGEFTQRAFLNGKLDYDQASGVLDLIDAKTNRAADMALARLSGKIANECRLLYDYALAISVDLEHALDVDEGELPASFVETLGERVAKLAAEIDSAIRRENEGKILRDGALVVLAGRPNAGKSSLMNALLDENRAIVRDIPGTTRDSIEEWLDLDGWPMRLVDTAGLRSSEDAIESEGVRRSEELIRRADVVIDFEGELKLGKSVVIHAKCDLSRGCGINVSAKTGEGLETLKAALVERVSKLDFGGADTKADALISAKSLLPADCSDLVIAGNAMRQVCDRLGESIGASYSEDLLDRLFSRFCVGK